MVGGDTIASFAEEMMVVGYPIASFVGTMFLRYLKGKETARDRITVLRRQMMVVTDEEMISNSDKQSANK